jgi:hypothetical protein
MTLVQILAGCADASDAILMEEGYSERAIGLMRRFCIDAASNLRVTPCRARRWAKALATEAGC